MEMTDCNSAKIDKIKNALNKHNLSYVNVDGDDLEKVFQIIVLNDLSFVEGISDLSSLSFQVLFYAFS